MKATHEGWLLFCPIWAADPFGECEIVAKYRFSLLLSFAIETQNALNWFTGFFMTDFEPVFAISIRELPQPITINY